MSVRTTFSGLTGFPGPGGRDARARTSRRRVSGLLVAACLPILAAWSISRAGPLEQSQVGSDANWVVHVDVEAALRSALGRFLIDRNTEGFESAMSAFKSSLGLDPSTDLQGLTIYGAQNADDAVGIIIDNGNITDFFDRVASMPGHRVETLKAAGQSGEIHSWTAAGRRCFAAARPHGPRSRIAVFSPSRDRLLTALGVLDRRLPNLTASTCVALKRPPREGTILFAAARRIDTIAGPALSSAVATRAQSARLEIGETAASANPDHAEVFVDARITARSPQAASEIRSALQGAVSAAERKLPASSPLPVVLTSLAIDLDGDDVVVTARRAAREIAAAVSDFRLLTRSNTAQSRESLPREKSDPR